MSTESTAMSRRDLLRRGTAAGIAVGGVGYGSLRLDHGPVQNSQAIAPVVAAGAIGGSIAVGWALREFEVLGADDVADGLGPSELQLQSYDTARARKSNNQSTIVDNLNIVESGLSNTLYSDAKIAAIEALNDQKSESEVLDAAQNAIDDYATTVLKNLFKSWNESVKEYSAIMDRIVEHPDLGPKDVTGLVAEGTNDNPIEPDGPFDFTYTYTFPDNSEMEITGVKFKIEGNTNSISWAPDRKSDFADFTATTDYDGRFTWEFDSGKITYMDHSEWNAVYEDLETVRTNVEDGIALWVDKVYSDVQAGDLDTSELLTSREQAALTTDDEDFPQALADLEALNVSVDYEREAEIYLSEIGATLYGRLGYTGDETLSTGNYDPDADLNGTVYLTYDVSEGSGEWDSFETGVDGGTVTFSSEPFEETEYMIQTVAGETATVVADDFSENDTGDAWTVDISGQVDDSVTEIEAVDFYATTSETSYETIQLSDPFEIVTFTDSEGQEYAESSFEKSEPQDDSNYITEEEWKEQQERHDELIEKYEESQQTTVPGVEDVLNGEANGLIGIAVVGFVLVSAILSALNPLS